MSASDGKRAIPPAVVLLACGLLTLPPSLFAAEPFRATTGHRFDDPARWSRVFDDPSRDEWQKPDELVAAIGIGPGSTVADVGAGTGYFSRTLSRAVGPEGTVFAVDVEPALVERLRERAEREGTANVIPVLGSRDDPRLPPAGIDVVLLVDTYHHLDHRLDYFRGLRRALRPGGRIVVVDWKKEDLPVGPKADHKLAAEAVVEEMATAGYRSMEVRDVLPYQYVLVFHPREPQPALPVERNLR